MMWSRVSKGMLCTTLVAAMISSAGSLLGAKMRMCASRLSICIPAKAGSEYAAPDLDLMPEAAYQIDSLTVVWEDAGDRPAMLRHDKAIGVELVQQRQTLLLELRGSNPLHHRRLRAVDHARAPLGHGDTKAFAVPGKLLIC